MSHSLQQTHQFLDTLQITKKIRQLWISFCSTQAGPVGFFDNLFPSFLFEQEPNTI